MGGQTGTDSRHDVTCAVCSATSLLLAPAGVPEGASPDFDTRPGSPATPSMLETWIAECPRCGYCAEDLSSASEDAAEIVAGQEYKERLASNDLPVVARRFACYALLVEKAHLWCDAGWIWLHAAWACDDAADEEDGTYCRKMAIDRWKRGKELGQSFAEDLASEFAIVTDLYRRAGEFENAVVTCGEALDLEDIPGPIEQMLRRQMTLIQRRDRGRHSMMELHDRSVIDDSAVSQET
jgi:hypothetical protein